jgi:hypothetical protein
MGQVVFKTECSAGEATQVNGEIEGVPVMVALLHPRACAWQILVVERPAKCYAPLHHLDEVLALAREMGCDRITVQLNTASAGWVSA